MRQQCTNTTALYGIGADARFLGPGNTDSTGQAHALIPGNSRKVINIFKR